MFPEPINLFGLSVHWFGVLALLSILTGYLVTAHEIGRRAIATGMLPDLAFAIMIPAFLGARLLFILEYWPAYLASPVDIFKFWQGGLVLSGDLFGGHLFRSLRDC